ncbi:MAG: hypothetical protein ACR5LD_11305 [Symbiopectobacterium sp.]
MRVSANTRHWFNCGAQPSFTAIRIFTNPAGWWSFDRSKIFY